MTTYDEIAQAFKQTKDERVKRIRARKMSQEDAEDVVQETFYRALKYSNTFNPKLQELNVWLDCIMNNAFKDYRSANLNGDFSFTEEESEVDPEQTTADASTLEHIKEEICTLSVRDQQVVYANMILGHSYKDCCKIFDLKYELVHEIIKQFRKYIKEKYV